MKSLLEAYQQMQEAAEVCPKCKKSPCECDSVEKELKGKQIKLDKNKNGKLDSDDFKKLRKEDSVPFAGPYTKSKGTVTDKSGAKHTGMSRARDLARKALANTQKKSGFEKYSAEKDKLKPKHFGMAEEVELAEANHRDFASQSKMHPDMAKHMTVGQHTDYYEPKTGDKVHGKVMHKSDTEVHMKQTHDSYDPKKKGTVHKFAVTSKLDEQIDEVLKPSMGAAAYIDDFVKSKNPKFAGKSKETRKQMALAAYYAAKKTVKEAKDEHEYGYEGDMAMNQLKTLTRCAEMITDMLKPDTDLPEWVQSKITLATDYIQTAADYMYSEMNEEDNVDEAWVLRQKKKDKKTVKEESVKTFKDFLAYINEVKLADLPVRRIKGHSYGNQPEDHDDDEDHEDHKPAMKKPQPTEKRGRGRPAGAKSGARQQGTSGRSEYSGITHHSLNLPNSNK